MIISKLGVEETKKYYPIITFKSFVGRKNKKYDYIITTLSNKNKDKFVFEQMEADGFDVKHIKHRIISGGSYVHDFGLNLDGNYNDIYTVSSISKKEDYEKIQKLFNELENKLVL